MRLSVAELYTRLWDFFWTPIRWIAGIFLSHEWLPQFRPWIVTAYVGHWPERVPDSELTDEEREMVRQLRKRLRHG